MNVLPSVNAFSIFIKKNIYFFSAIIFGILIPLNIQGQSILINEFMASNNTIAVDEFGESDDWVELYNPSDTAIDIGGMYITDDLAEPMLWQIPATEPQMTTISPNGYLLLWFDKEPTQGVLHVNAKLGSSGEDIALFASDGITLIDSRTFLDQFADVSEGRTPNGGADWDYYPEPTPNAENDTDPGLLKAESPIASQNSGLFNDTQFITLSTSVPNGSIHYTIDGSVPTINSPEYTDTISISQTTPLRAVSIADGYHNSDPVTFNYLINVNHTFPVVTITASDESLFDSATGMYSNYTEDIDIPAHVELIEPNGTVGFSQIAEIEIHGSASAAIPQKSIALKAKKSLGGKEFEYPVFPDLDTDAYRSLIVRNSGQDNNLTMFRDALVSSLVRDLSDVDGIITKPKLYTQGYRPSVLYLNGEYWGIYNLRERADKRYIKVNFDLDDDEIDLIEGFGEVKEGDADNWNSLINFFNETDLSNDSNFELLEATLDTEHFLDYVVFNVFNDNHDWPDNNNRRWRERVPEGKWRYLTYDLDFTFGLFTAQGWNTGAWYNNSLARLFDEFNTAWPNSKWTTLPFRKMVENEKWRTDFINRMADQLNVLYNADRVNQRIDSFRATYEPEMPQHIDRWTQGTLLWDEHIDKLKMFADNRVESVRSHFVSAFPQVSGTADVTLNASPANGGQVKFSTITLGQNEFPWNAIYFKGTPIPAEAIPNPGFVFTGWSVGSMGNNSSSNITLSENISITANFQPIGNQQTQTISLAQISDQLTTNNSFQIDATSSSGLPVSLSIISGPATISGNTITLVGTVGTVTVEASQSGNTDYLPAPIVTRIFNVTEPIGSSGPTVLLSTPNLNITSSFTVNIEFDEFVNDLTLAEIIVTNGTKSNPAGFGTSYSFTVTPSDFGVITISVPSGSAFNNNGEPNQISNTLVVNYDNPNISSPTVILTTSSLNVNGSFNVNAQFSEPVSDFQIEDVQISNGTKSNPGGLGANYNFLVTPVTSGDITIVVPAGSANNNDGAPNLISNTLTVSYLPNIGGCSNPENLALGGLATQSGTQQNGSADKAIDGNTDGIAWVTNSVSITDWLPNAYWEIDLGSVSTIDEIRIWNREDCCLDKLKDYHILISDDPFNSTELNATIFQSGVSDIYQTEIAGRPTSIPVNQSGRYVRVQLEGTGFLQLAEIEIMGCQNATPIPFEQTINFPNISDKQIDDPSFTIDATASSGLPVSLEIVSGPATIIGNTVSLTGDLGTVTITASQAGNSDYNAASSVTRNFNVIQTTPSNPYCESYASIQSSEWIQTVLFNEISNNSGADGGYGDFTNQSTTLQAGSSYPILLTPGYLGTAYQETWRVWIDFNQDGDFQDANELLFNQKDNIPISGNIEIPTAVNNGPTRMRVSMKWNTPANECDIFNFGEVEDYTVNISGGTGALIAFFPNNIFSSVEKGLQAKAFPNPVEHSLVVDYTTSKTGLLNISITNLNGKTVYIDKHEVLTGGDRLIIDVADLPAGTYTLFLKQGSQQKAIRIIKIMD